MQMYKSTQTLHINTIQLYAQCVKDMHYTTRGEQIPGNQFFMMAPNICGSSVWNLLHVTQLAPTILRWLIDFLLIYVPLH